MKKTNENNNQDNILRSMLFPSFICILVCVFLLLGTTFAWFTDSTESGITKFTAGSFSVSVTIEDNNTSSLYPVSNNRSSLVSGSYTITISNNSSTASGYALVTITSDTTKVYLVDTFPITFTITTLEDVEFGCTPYLGSNKPTSIQVIADGDNISLSLQSSIPSFLQDSVSLSLDGRCSL